MNMHAPDALLFVLIASTALLSADAFADDDASPYWQRRYLEVLEEERQVFVGPAVGRHVVVTQRIGGPVRGRIVEVDASSVKLSNGATYTADRLVPESAAMLFATAFAPEVARNRVAREKREFEADLEREAEEKRIAAERERREEVRRQRTLSERIERERLAKMERQRIEESKRRRKAENTRAIGYLLLLIGASVIYVFPSICAFARRHHNRGAITILNLLVGWTFLGWVGAMVWAATTVKDAEKGRRP